MRKSLKRIITLALALSMFTSTAYAGQWVEERNNWKYRNDNGSYVTGWNWIDGKSYYFDTAGNMLANTTTPDGYQVNADGAWVIDGVVQTQGRNSSGSVAYDPQYPLKGYIEQWLETNPDTGRTQWKWDTDKYPEMSNVYAYYMECAIRDQNPMYLVQFGNAELAAICEVAGYQHVGLEYVNQEHKQKIVSELRDFLNSFDWRNSSDLEKAIHVAKRITRAEYSNAEEVQYSYSCLADNLANCNGFTNAAILLSACIGLNIGTIGSASHVYPVFQVDGVWLAYEPTTKNSYFTVANVYERNFLGDYTKLGNYCAGVGYEIPTDISDRFPNVKNYWGYGEERQAVYFD